MPRRHNRKQNRLAKVVIAAERYVEKRWVYDPVNPRVAEILKNDPTAVSAINLIRGSDFRANQVQRPSL